MPKTIQMSLNSKSIDKAIKELKEYKAWVERKTQELIDEMLAYGEDFAINQVGHVDSGYTLDSIVSYRNGNKGVIVAGGNAVWLEFGTGVRYNGPSGSSPHPMGEKLGMLIGEYGDKHGSDPNGWWYYDGTTVKHTYGVQANMFMYKTAQELRRIYPEIAKEVFSNA